MFRASYIVFVLSLLISLISCSDDDNPIVRDEDQFIYPLEIGNTWEYDSHFATFNYRTIDSLDYPRYDDSVHYYSKIKVEIVKAEKVYDDIETFVIRSVESGSTMQNLWSEHYYRNNADGLYLYGYKLYGTGGNGLPKRSNSEKIIFNGKVFDSVTEIVRSLDMILPKTYSVTSDSIQYENPPLKIINYPLETSNVWIFRPPNKPFAISKKLIGNESIDYNSQKIQCYKIEWLYDINGDNEWDENISVVDFVSDKGLMKRTILMKDLAIMTSESPDVNGYFDSAEEITLTNTNL